MTTLYVDTETFNTVDIKVGVPKYMETVEVTLVSWAVDDGPVHVLDMTRDYTAFDADFTKLHAGWKQFYAAWNNADRYVAHNVPFDKPALASLDLHSGAHKWHCTQARALAHSLPASMAALSEVYNLGDKAKDKRGKQLVQLFCKPRPKNSKLRRATRETHPKEWAEFIEYARQDVVALRELDRKLPTWNLTDTERQAWLRNQRINDRGMLIDLDLAQAAIETVEAHKEKRNDDVRLLADGLSVTQRDALLAHLRTGYGLHLPDLRGATVERILDDPDLDAGARELLSARLEVCQTSTAKWPKLLSAASSDGRLRGTAQFCGASRTGRDAGRIFQPLNLPRPPKYLKSAAAFDTAVQAIKGRVADLCYDDPIEVCAATLRGAIVAPEGKKLVVSDLNAIEGRVLAWLAGEQWKLDAYAKGFDLYVLAYATAFRRTLLSVTEAERQVGKVMELALGFGGAVGAFSTMAGNYGVNLPEDEVVALVKAWRKANPAIVKFWYALEDAFRMAATSSGNMDTWVAGSIKVSRRGSWVLLELPSGRALCYPSLRVDDDGQLTYLGTNQYTRKWERIKTYGGKLAENATQGCARDVLVHGMERTEENGAYDIILTCYDEVVSETVSGTEAEHSALLASVPPWAPGLPLRAEGFETTRYRKS